MISDKYVGTDNYNRAMNIFNKLSMDEHDKHIMSSVICSIIANNKEVDAENVFDRVENFETLSHEAMKDNAYGFCNFSENKIAIDFKIDRYSSLYYEVVAHETVHFAGNVNGITGLNRKDFPKTYEVATQKIASDVCKDLGINIEKDSAINCMNEFNQRGLLGYKSYGNGYSGINRVGDTLFEMDRESFIGGYFGSNYGISLENETIKASFVQLEKALERDHSSYDINSFYQIKKDTSVATQNLFVNFYLNGSISADEYLSFANNNAKNNVYFSDNHFGSINILHNHLVATDILTYGQHKGISMERLSGEINSKHTDKIELFTIGCEMLRRSRTSYSVDDLDDAKILSIHNGGRDYITLKINGEAIKAIGTRVGENYYIDLEEHSKDFGIYRKMGFSERDLNPHPDTRLKLDELAFIQSQLNKGKSLGDDILYASYLGQVISPDRLQEQYSFRPDIFFELLERGYAQNLAQNLGPNRSLYEFAFIQTKDGDMGIQHMLKGPDWKEAIDLIHEKCKESNFQEFPIDIDIKGLSRLHNTNILTYIYELDNRMLVPVLEKSNVDINFEYGLQNIATSFYKDGGQIFYDKYIQDNGGNNYRWFIQNGIDLEMPIIVNGERLIFQEAVLKDGTFEDIRALVSRPDCNLNNTCANSERMTQDMDNRGPIRTPIEYISDFGYHDKILKLNVILESGNLPDFNMENSRGLTCLESSLEKYSPDDKMMININREFILKLVDAGADLNHVTTYGNEFITAGNMFAKSGDVDLIKMAIESHGVKFEDVFNQHTPSEWLDKFGIFEMKELKALSDSLYENPVNGTSISASDMVKEEDEMALERHDMGFSEAIEA